MSYTDWELDYCLFEGQVDKSTGEIIPSQTPKEPHDPVLAKLLKSSSPAIFEEFITDDVGEWGQKVRWTNWALEELMEFNDATGKNFTKLASLLVSRNIVFARSKEISETLGVSMKNLNSYLKKLRDNNLIVEVDSSLCAHPKGCRIIFLNPTLVWKGWFQPSTDVVDNENYGSSYRFSYLHRHYVDMWCDSYFHKLSKE